MVEVMISQDEVDRAGHGRFHHQEGIRYGRRLGYVSGNQYAVGGLCAELIQEPPYLAKVEEFQVDVIEPDSSHLLPLCILCGLLSHVAPMIPHSNGLQRPPTMRRGSCQLGDQND